VLWEVKLIYVINTVLLVKMFVSFPLNELRYFWEYLKANKARFFLIAREHQNTTGKAWFIIHGGFNPLILLSVYL